MQEDRAEVTSSVIGLVEWLEATMQHNPLPPLRNMAYWTMNHLLDALQVSHADWMRKQWLDDNLGLFM